MTPEERELLTRAIQLSEENNKMLRQMRRHARFSAFFRLAYWVLIIGISIFAYLTIQPYLNAAFEGYSEMQKSIESVKNVTTKLPSLPDWMTKGE